jgi:hypothetical protein
MPAMRHGATPIPVWAWIGVGFILARPGLALGAEPYYLPDERLGIRTAPLLLLTRVDVRTDLKMTPEQTASALRAIEDLHARAESLRGKGNTPDVRRARKALDLAEQQWIDANLTGLQQSRLVQIDLQWEGPSALARPVIADAVGLTNDQSTALARLLQERRRQRVAGKNRPEDERQFSGQALSLLSDEQKARWQAMTGEPFVLSTSDRPRTTASRP